MEWVIDFVWNTEAEHCARPLPVPSSVRPATSAPWRSAGAFPRGAARGCSDNPKSRTGHIKGMQHLNARIGEAGAAWFWFHALRNCFITVSDRDLILSASLTKRLVNHARPQDVTEGYAAD